MIKFATSRKEVKTCPFCGEQPEMVQSETYGDWTIWCIQARCRARVEVTDADRATVVLIWNTRDAA